MTGVRTRFAPSPTGLLHVGHAYAAITAYNVAKQRGGEFILRIENIDHLRCDDEAIEQIYQDLSWLGLTWREPVRVQSEHMSDYDQALQKLEAMDVLYPCFCSRKDIKEEIARAAHAPHGPEGPLYPGTCRALSREEKRRLLKQNVEYAMRLDLEKSLSLINQDELFWRDIHHNQIFAQPHQLGDVVIARKDIGTSYHLSVVVDDALQNITHVTRGEELEFATHIHCVLQKLLGLPVPIYHHHQLITDQDGQKFSKRDQSETLASYRNRGVCPHHIYELIGLSPKN